MDNNNGDDNSTMHHMTPTTLTMTGIIRTTITQITMMTTLQMNKQLCKQGEQASWSLSKKSKNDI